MALRGGSRFKRRQCQQLNLGEFLAETAPSSNGELSRLCSRSLWWRQTQRRWRGLIPARGNAPGTCRVKRTRAEGPSHRTPQSIGKVLEIIKRAIHLRSRDSLARLVCCGRLGQPALPFHKKGRAFLPGLLLFETGFDQKLAVRPTPSVRGLPGMCRIMPASRGAAGLE